MKYLQIFEVFKKEQEFKGKTNTYLYDNIHDKNGERMGTCKKCGRVVNIISHDPGVDGKNCKEKTIF